MCMRIVFVFLSSLLFFVNAEAFEGQEFVVIDGISYESTFNVSYDPISDTDVITSPPSSFTVLDANCSGKVAIKDKISFKLGDTDYTLPVVAIGIGAFSDCKYMTSLVIPGSVVNIEWAAFSGCSALTDITCMASTAPSFSPDNASDVTNITLHVPGTAKKSYLGKSPWSSFKDIVSIPGTELPILTYIVDGEVYKTYEYESGSIINKEENPTKKGYTFCGWSEIPETMPDHDVTVTGSFSINTYKLTYTVDGEEYKVVEVKYDEDITAEPEPTERGKTFSGWCGIPQKMPANNVTVKGTFSWSKKTVDNVIYEVYDATNNYCKAIGNESASGAVKIAEMVDSDDSYNVTAISDNAFNGCKNITSIEIPATITNIGERAFANIDKLTDVTILATDLPETDRTAFENSYIEDYVTLHVPEASLEKYKAAAPWKNFKEVVGIAGPKKCATPTITFADGKVKFACETEGVTFKYEIKNADNFEGEGDEIEMGGVYNVSVYATKDDYIDSDKATTQIKLSTIKGDINGDGKVNAADHVELSNIIMGIHEEEAEVEQEETE